MRPFAYGETVNKDGVDVVQAKNLKIVSFDMTLEPPDGI
jgi:hypothetical protein